MRKLNILIAIALCLTLCYCQQCVSQYQGIDETTGHIIVEGQFLQQGSVDHGEYFQGGYYESDILEYGLDGEYQVKGIYSLFVSATVEHPRLCTFVYNQDITLPPVNYFFIRIRDPSRIGLPYSEKEVTPNMNRATKNVLESFLKTAETEKQTAYVIDQLQELEESINTDIYHREY